MEEFKESLGGLEEGEKRLVVGKGFHDRKDKFSRQGLKLRE
jgi:hypothetical protein